MQASTFLTAKTTTSRTNPITLAWVVPHLSLGTQAPHPSAVLTACGHGGGVQAPGATCAANVAASVAVADAAASVAAAPPRE